MKKKETNTAKRMQTIAICSCLCLLAVGAGVAYRAFDSIPAETADITEEPQEQPVTVVQTPTLDTAIFERNKQSNDDGEAPEAEQPKQTEQKQPAQKAEPPAEPVFAYPVKGDVVLPYSVDHAIYDPTLEQYRTNASISLSAEQGTKVKAAADGKVKEITEDTEAGNIVTIEHANGWLTTYGQLEDTVSVREGETVAQGQVIGAVDAPTKYGTALGAHLEFAMEKDGVPVDPQEKLKAE